MLSTCAEFLNTFHVQVINGHLAIFLRQNCTSSATFCGHLGEDLNCHVTREILQIQVSNIQKVVVTVLATTITTSGL